MIKGKECPRSLHLGAKVRHTMMGSGGGDDQGQGVSECLCI